MKKAIIFMIVAIVLLHGWITLSILAQSDKPAESIRESIEACGPVYLQILGIMGAMWTIEWATSLPWGKWGQSIKKHKP